MKKYILLLTCFFALLASGLVSAEGVRDTTGPLHNEMIAAGGQGGDYLGIPEPTLYQERMQIQAGNIDVAGKRIQFAEMANNRLEFRIGDIKGNTKLQLQQEVDGRMTTQLSNGRNAEIKIMPDTASEMALTRLRLRVCNESNNCSIELKEVGQGNQTRLAYELNTQRQSRLFGLFPAKMQVQAQIDAETGEVIRTQKPWWAFLAAEPEE